MPIPFFVFNTMLYIFLFAKSNPLCTCKSALWTEFVVFRQHDSPVSPCNWNLWYIVDNWNVLQSTNLSHACFQLFESGLEVVFSVTRVTFSFTFHIFDGNKLFLWTIDSKRYIKIHIEAWISLMYHHLDTNVTKRKHHCNLYWLKKWIWFLVTFKSIELNYPSLKLNVVLWKFEI